MQLDTDFLLLPVLADYLLTTPQGSGRGEAFLSQESRLNPGTLRSLLQTNVDHVLNLTAPFASNQSATNLLMIRDQLVGNWRDSGTGLGYGKIPFDVNTAFVGAALTSIAALSDAGVLPANYSTPARQAAEVWNTNAAAYFEVNIDAATAQSRLQTYVTQSNLTDATIYGNGVLNGTASNMTSSGNTTSTIGGTAGSNSTFYAVSLLADGTPVEVRYLVIHAKIATLMYVCILVDSAFRSWLRFGVQWQCVRECHSSHYRGPPALSKGIADERGNGCCERR